MRKWYREDNEAIPAYKYEQAPPSGYTLVTDPAELKTLTVAKYKKRTKDGIATFEEVRADLALNLESGAMTIAQAFEIETKLETVKAKIITGDWKTGQYEMSLITPSGALTPEIYNSIKEIIDNYVAASY